jgi:hypothetical protein
MSPFMKWFIVITVLLLCLLIYCTSPISNNLSPRSELEKSEVQTRKEDLIEGLQQSFESAEFIVKAKWEICTQAGEKNHCGNFADKPIVSLEIANTWSEPIWVVFPKFKGANEERLSCSTDLAKINPGDTLTYWCKPVSSFIYDEIVDNAPSEVCVEIKWDMKSRGYIDRLGMEKSVCGNIPGYP